MPLVLSKPWPDPFDGKHSYHMLSLTPFLDVKAQTQAGIYLASQIALNMAYTFSIADSSSSIVGSNGGYSHYLWHADDGRVLYTKFLNDPIHQQASFKLPFAILRPCSPGFQKFDATIIWVSSCISYPTRPFSLQLRLKFNSTRSFPYLPQVSLANLQDPSTQHLAVSLRLSFAPGILLSQP